MSGSRAATLIMVWFAALFSAAGPIYPAAAAPQRRVALVIGNSSYPQIGPLRNPGSDAVLIARTLQRLGFTLVGGKEHLNLDRAQFVAAIEKFGRDAAGADVALFYYAGHGMQVSGVNWLVPVDANPVRVQGLDFQMVDARLVLRQMDSAGTHLNIMILDACRNNPFNLRGLRGWEKGLAEMSVPDGTVISYATQPDSVAQEGTGADSRFSLALAAGMLHPGWEVIKAFNETGRAVKRATGGAQQPWFAASPIDGEYFFVTDGKGSTGPASGQGESSVAAISPGKSGDAVPPDLSSPSTTYAMGPIERNIDRFGGDYDDFSFQSVEACRERCRTEPRCRAFAFAIDIKHCWLKDVVNAPRPSKTIYSGLKSGN